MDFEFVAVDSIDKVPEQFRPLYKDGEGDNAGKAVPNPEYKGVIEAIVGFDKTAKTLRGELKTAKAGKVDLTVLAEYGDTPEAIAEAVKAAVAEAGNNKNADVTKAVEAAKKALAEGHAKEIEKHTQRNQGLQAQLYTQLVENEATAAIAEAKGVPRLLMPFVREQVKVAEENGELRVNVVNAQGEVRYGMTGSPMSIKELVAEMKGQEEFGRLFESEERGGGGFQPGGTRRSASMGDRKLSANEKIALGLTKGQFKRSGK